MAEIGILHPGDMGVSVAASAINSGSRVYWASDGRSQQTRRRAEKHGLLDAGSLDALCRRSEVVISVCPPSAAEEVAASVRRASFRGLYLDANAISPQRSVRIAQDMTAAGIEYVDGSLFGPPAWEPGSTRLWLSGEKAAELAGLFDAGPLATCLFEGPVGKASALKMCYAAITKGTTALLGAIQAAAGANGVLEELQQEWDLMEPGFKESAEQRARRVTAKAWRFEGEMREIAATFEAAGLPGGFHLAAAEIYHRLSGFKDQPTPPIELVMEVLLDG